jgi:hypothetical protein
MQALSKKHGKRRNVSANTVTKSRLHTGVPAAIKKRIKLEKKKTKIKK